MKKGLGFLLLIPTLMAFAPHQEPGEKYAKYMGEKGWIYIRNYELIKSVQGGQAVITGEGRPITIEDTGNGMTITGLNVRVILKPGPTGTMILDQATVSGSARAVFNSDLHYQTAVEMATANRPAPEKPTETSIVTLDSDSMVFTREGEDGVLTFPQSTKVAMDSKGTRSNANTRSTYTQKLNIEGSKGRFTSSMSPTGQFTGPRTGRLEGPVTMHLVRDETTPDAPNLPRVERTDLTGNTDLVEFDLTTLEPRMTFTGNVQIKGQARGLPGEIQGDKGIINFDRMFQIASYEFTGAPTKTRIKVDDARLGGGR